MSEEVINNPTPIITKACTKCKVDQPLENYRKNPSNKKDGRQLECKKCNDERAAIYYNNNKKKIIKKIMSSRREKEQEKKRLAKEIQKLQKQVELNKENNNQNAPVFENNVNS